MTLLNHETGELIETIGADEARRLTTEARNEFRSSREHFDRAWSLIEEAVQGGGHVDLGYRSPADYLHAEFDGVLSGLDVPSRRTAVRTMTDWGLSTRAIAPVVGVSQKTVVKDSQVIPEVSPDQTPDPAELHAAGSGNAVGPQQPATPQGESAPEGCNPGSEQSSTPDGPTSATPRPAVTGIDGKTYTRPEPKPRPVLVGDAADYDNAEKACQYLSRAISKLLEFQHPNMRDGMRRYWSMASREVPPTPRRDVTPEQMRIAAQGLLTLADEWDS